MKINTLKTEIPQEGEIKEKKKLRGFAGIVYKQLLPLNTNKRYKEEHGDVSLKFLLNPIDQLKAALVIFDEGTVDVEEIQKDDPLMKMRKKQIGYDAKLQVTTQMMFDIASGKMSIKQLLKAEIKDKKIKVKGKLKLLKLIKAFVIASKIK